MLFYFINMDQPWECDNRGVVSPRAAFMVTLLLLSAHHGNMDSKLTVCGRLLQVSSWHKLPIPTHYSFLLIFLNEMFKRGNDVFSCCGNSKKNFRGPSLSTAVFFVVVFFYKCKSQKP